MIFETPYKEILSGSNLPEQISLLDHLNGFDSSLNNVILTRINESAIKQNRLIQVNYHQILEPEIANQYSNLILKFVMADRTKQDLWTTFTDYHGSPDINYKNFICSFNGSPHVGRKFLVSCLNKFGYFNSDYCSKNFSIDSNELDGHIFDFVGNRDNFYRKFFTIDCLDFLEAIYNFNYTQHNHKNNIYNLDSKLTESFLHIVSETYSTSYYPFVTEKFLYSIVTRGLFLAYAQPGWHAHVEKYYGFKKYDKLFDYRFDTIKNPIERLIELLSMVYKFSFMSVDDWNDLYLIERETIEYNCDHYYSGGHLKMLSQYE